MKTPAVTIQLLADHPDLIPVVGHIRWSEWGHPPEPESLDWWVDISGTEAGRDRLPVTWVAIDGTGNALGVVGLAEFDPEERRERSPWVVGMIVAAQQRNLGIGSLLLGTLEAWALGKGYPRLWVATGGRAVNFYQKCGWELREVFDRPSTGEVVTILAKEGSGSS